MEPMTQKRAFSGSIGVYEWCARNFTEHLGSPNYVTARHSYSSRLESIALLFTSKFLILFKTSCNLNVRCLAQREHCESWRSRLREYCKIETIVLPLSHWHWASEWGVIPPLSLYLYLYAIIRDWGLDEELAGVNGSRSEQVKEKKTNQIKYKYTQVHLIKLECRGKEFFFNNSTQIVKFVYSIN